MQKMCLVNYFNVFWISGSLVVELELKVFVPFAVICRGNEVLVEKNWSANPNFMQITMGKN